MPTAIYPGDDIRSYPMQYYPNGGHQGHQTGPYTTPQYAYPPGMGPNLSYAGGPVGMGNAAGSMVGGGFHPGRAYESLGYDYQLPSRGYSAENSWSGWDLAQAQYGGRDPGFDRGWFDGIIGSVSSFFSSRRMRYEDAKEAHRRIYFYKEYQTPSGMEDISSRVLGGAAAFQAFLIWDKEHFSVYNERPSQENRERLISLAVGELYSLYERLGLLPTTRTATHTLRLNESAEAAAATAKYMYDRHYDPEEGVYSRYGGDGGSGGMRHRRSGSFVGGDRDRDRDREEYGRPRRHRRHGSDSGRESHSEREREREEMMRRDQMSQMSQMSGGGMPGMGMMGMGGNPMGMGMQAGPGMSPYGMRSPMLAPAGMMGMGPGMGGPMANSMMHGGNNMAMMQAQQQMGNPMMLAGGPQLENMMMGQNSAMHGQAMPVMTPEEGEGPVPDYYDMMTQNGMGMGSGMMGQGMAQGMGYGGQGMGMGNMMGMGQGGMPGQMQGGYGMPRSWYGRQQYDPSRM